MLLTYVHQKEYTSASYDVAHLYEHLVIHSFYTYLESHQVQPGFIGYVGGETFEKVVFLQASFYNKRIADLYEKFLSKPIVADDSFILHALRELEAEDRVSLTVRDKASFNQQLQSLITTTWIDNNSVISSSMLEVAKLPDSPLETKKIERDFREVLVGIYAENSDLDNNERTLLLRLLAILGDTIHLEMRQKLHCAYVEDPAVMADNEYIGNTYNLRFNKKIPLRTIKNLVEAKLLNMDIDSIMPLINAQFEEYSQRSSWNDKVIDYFRYTGIVTSNAYIASLATPDRIATVISKLKIHVRVTRA